MNGPLRQGSTLPKTEMHGELKLEFEAYDKVNSSDKYIDCLLCIFVYVVQDEA